MNKFFRFILSFPHDHEDIFALTLAYSIFAIGGAIYWAAIPILGENVFKLDPFIIGLIMALIGVIYIITDNPIGILIDYVGYKNGALLGIACSFITALLSLLPQSLPLFLTEVIFIAFSWNLFTDAASAYILYTAPKSIEGRMFGTYGSLYKFGVLISTFFIASISGWGFGNVGIFCLATFIPSLLIVLLFVKPEKRKYDKNFLHAIKSYIHAPSLWKRGWTAMKEFSPVSWVMAIDGFTGYLFTATLWFAVPLSLSTFANPFVTEGFALGVFDFAGTIFGMAGGFLADKYSRKKLFLTLLGIVFLGMLALGFAPNVYFFFLFAFIAAAASDASGAPLNAMLSDVDKKHDKDGTIYGFTGIFTDLAFIVGPVFGSIVFRAFGLQGIFVFLALAALTDFLLATFLLRNFNHDKKRQTA